MKIEKIVVENLKCGGCAATITKHLRSLDQVKDVQVDIENSTVTIAHEADGGRQSFVEALTKLGYPEAGASKGASRLVHQVMSYVSCAIGKVS